MGQHNAVCLKNFEIYNRTPSTFKYKGAKSAKMVKRTSRTNRMHTKDDRSSELVEVISSSTHELKIRSSDSSFEIESTGKIVRLPLDDRPRLVRFSLDHSFFPVTHHRDIPKECKKDIWYRRTELKRMRAPSGETKDLEGSSDAKPKDSFVECQRALHKLMAISLVLDEQARQKRMDHVDPLLIAQKYHTFVSRSRSSLFMCQLARGPGGVNVNGGSGNVAKLAAIH